MSYKSMSARVAAFLLAASAIVSEGSTNKVGAADWAPKDPPSIYVIGAGPNAVRRTDFINDVCVTAVQLDCVESIAAQLNGTWVLGTATESLVGDSRTWNIPGVVNLNGSTQVSVTHKLNYTGNAFLQTQINAVPVNGSSGDLDQNSLPLGVKFRAVVRTSWVLPTHVSGKSTETKVTVEKLATSGASRIAMEGIPTVHMIVLDNSTITSPTGKGANDVRALGMTVSDGRFYPVKKECVEKSTIMTSENGYGHPLPTYADGKFDLKLQSPHFRTDGVTEHIGVYEAFIPTDMAECLWAEPISSTDVFAASVFETAGEAKPATTTVTVTSEGVVIKASGFTYSSPTIRVSKSSSPKASATAQVGSTLASPTGVKAVGAKQTASVSFARQQGVRYSVSATKGSTKKTFVCSLGKTRITCKASRLAAGKWKVTVVATSGSKRSTPSVTNVVVKY
jgi:hypothetical protein